MYVREQQEEFKCEQKKYVIIMGNAKYVIQLLFIIRRMLGWIDLWLCYLCDAHAHTQTQTTVNKMPLRINAFGVIIKSTESKNDAP